MPRHPKTTLWMLIKVVLKKRYVRVKEAENGRLIPAVKGDYEPGNYYLRYTLNGKRKWESVGGDLTIALQEQKARQDSLQLVPSASVATLPTRKTVAEAVKKFIANKNGEDRHSQRRARSWNWLLSENGRGPQPFLRPRASAVFTHRKLAGGKAVFTSPNPFLRPISWLLWRGDLHY